VRAPSVTSYSRLAVTAPTNKYDPDVRAVHQLRRICLELGQFGDIVVESKKSLAQLQALPDQAV